MAGGGLPYNYRESADIRDRSAHARYAAANDRSDSGTHHERAVRGTDCVTDTVGGRHAFADAHQLRCQQLVYRYRYWTGVAE